MLTGRDLEEDMQVNNFRTTTEQYRNETNESIIATTVYNQQEDQRIYPTYKEARKYNPDGYPKLMKDSNVLESEPLVSAAKVLV